MAERPPPAAHDVASIARWLAEDRPGSPSVVAHAAARTQPCACGAAFDGPCLHHFGRMGSRQRAEVARRLGFRLPTNTTRG